MRFQIHRIVLCTEGGARRHFTRYRLIRYIIQTHLKFHFGIFRRFIELTDFVLKTIALTDKCIVAQDFYRIVGSRNLNAINNSGYFIITCNQLKIREIELETQKLNTIRHTINFIFFIKTKFSRVIEIIRLQSQIWINAAIIFTGLSDRHIEIGRPNI